MDFLHTKGYTYHEIPTLTLWELRELRDGHRVTQEEKERQRQEDGGAKPGQKGRPQTRQKQANLQRFSQEVGSQSWYNSHAAELQRQPSA